MFSFIGSVSLLTALIGLEIAGVFTELTSIATFFAATGILVLMSVLAAYKLK
ncbi:hypothetical protein PGC35_06980 [Psychrobacillus sp. PGGUH221]|uniref:hypothetical protein n=1 Tax=Psychrobacillus sp. PGGUH221 TaxID=3020058 RepID=UPI0035C6BE8B